MPEKISQNKRKHRKTSPETWAKIALAHKGKKHTQETKNKIALAHKGMKLSDEAKKKISEANKGKKAWNKGKGLSEETKRKLSEANRGKHFSPATEFKKGHKSIPWNKGKKLPPEYAAKARKASLGHKHTEEWKEERRKAFSGDKNPMWKGGVTSEYQRIRTSSKYIQWRKAVFERDNYTCQRCGARNGNGKRVILQAHHIKSFAEYPELRFDINNGITLCLSCHKKTENYGKNVSTKSKR